MAVRKCRQLIEEIRKHNADCGAVRFCDQWHRICMNQGTDSPSDVNVGVDVCPSCRDFTLNEHCTCTEKDQNETEVKGE